MVGQSLDTVVPPAQESRVRSRPFCMGVRFCNRFTKHSEKGILACFRQSDWWPQSPHTKIILRHGQNGILNARFVGLVWSLE